MATSILPAVAPKVAQTHGISALSIGYQISLLAIAMLASLMFGANLAVRWGGCRVCQLGLVLVSVGCVVAVLPHPVFVFLSAFPLGCGYALLSPAASQLMMRFTPPERRNLMFSLKQTGVPFGGIGAAIFAPAVAIHFGWQWAMLSNGVAVLALAAWMERGRRHWDSDRDPGAKWITSPLGGFSTVWRHRRLRALGIAGGAFVVVQVCLSTYTVLFFVEDGKFGLVQAGLVLMVSQIGGVAGRVFWGWIADVVRDCFTTLAVLAAVMTVCALACAAITPAWPLAAAYALFFVLGSTASGWNGAFLAEVARLAPRSEVSSATGGSLFLVNLGRLVGPVLFVAGYQWSGSYASAFALLAVPSMLGLVLLLAARGDAEAVSGKR